MTEYTCPRGNPDCDCKPLYPGDRIAFHCITHDVDAEGTVLRFEMGHTYLARVDCGDTPSFVSTREVEVLSRASDRDE